MKVLIRRKYYDVPTTWDDLTSKQLVKCMIVLNGTMDEISGRLYLLKILTGMSWYKFFRTKAADLEDKLYLTDFLLLQNNLTRNLLPSYRVFSSLVKFYGPRDNFDNLRVHEFIFSDQYYRQYIDTNSESDLNMLIATIYRPAKRNYNIKDDVDGDIREQYNDNLTATYAKAIAQWPMGVKWAILQWFEGCRIELVKNNPAIFKGAGGDNEPLYGMWSIMRGVADKGLHGGMKNVERMFVKEFFMELNEIIAESKRIEELYKSSTQPQL